MKRYFLHVLIALDQFLNAVTGGFADETLSSRSYREARTGRRGRVVAEKCVDRLFFWQGEPCRRAWLRALPRAHFPVVLFADLPATNTDCPRPSSSFLPRHRR